METYPGYIFGLHPDAYRTGKTAAVLDCLACKDDLTGTISPKLRVRYSDGKIAYIPLTDIVAGRYRFSNGNWSQDKFNMWHHRSPWEYRVGEALEEACAFFGNGAALFWWKGIPTQLQPGDNPNTLFIRWNAAKERQRNKTT